MGGGDLNLKKSWHPHTMKNQEKVWKAEQAKNAEDRKMNDLRREIMEEKNREDLVKIGQSSGVLAKTDDMKLEWMYKSSSELLNREEYLLGRPIDKAFEIMEAEEKSKDVSGMKVPINDVENECIPMSIRSLRQATSTEQVDFHRKLLEDPLMMIKQKEIEVKRKILENPLKLKQLYKILKNEKNKKSKNSKDHSSKKNKKKKRRDPGSDESDGDLDEMLLKQYKKLKNKSKDSTFLDNLGLSKLLHSKYKTISSELDKAAKFKKEKLKKISNDRSSYSSRGSRSDERNETSLQRRSYRDMGRSPLDDRKDQGRDRETRYSVDRRDSRNDRNSYSPSERQSWNVGNRSSNYQSSPPYDRSDQRIDRERRYSVDRRDPRSYLNGYSSTERHNEISGNRSPYYHSNYRTNNRHQRRSHSRSPNKKYQSYRRRTRSPPRTKYSQRSPTKQNYSEQSRFPAQKQRLSNEEKEKRLKDMMDNATWRDKERTRYVQNYREEYQKEEQQNQAREFDKEFINTQIRNAISSHNSIESRIKSNVSNIQRTSAAMDANFAKK